MKKPASPAATTERRCAEIRRVVAEHFEISRAAITSRVRTEPLATIRQVAMLLARESTGATFQVIARSFGRGDHETVRAAYKAVPAKAETNRQLDLDLAGLRAKLKIACVAIK